MASGQPNGENAAPKVPQASTLPNGSSKSISSEDASSSTSKHEKKAGLKEAKGRRKRKRASEKAGHIASCDLEDEIGKLDGFISSSFPSSSHCSVEALLSVPLEFLFRGTSADPSAPSEKSTPQSASSRNSRNLFSRTEAKTLLRVSQLAYELDVLTSLSAQALERSAICRCYIDFIQNMEPKTTAGTGRHSSPASPLRYHLRPLLSILMEHGTTIPRDALHHVTTEMDRVLVELSACAAALEQFSEQNWNVADRLLDKDTVETIGDVMDDDAKLGKEKGMVADIEEAVAVRIQGILDMCSQSPFLNNTVAENDGPSEKRMTLVESPFSSSQKSKDTNDEESTCSGAPRSIFDSAVDRNTGEIICMKNLCQQLLCDGTKSATPRNGKDDDDNSSVDCEDEISNKEENTEDADRHRRRADTRPITESVDCAAEALTVLASLQSKEF